MGGCGHTEGLGRRSEAGYVLGEEGRKGWFVEVRGWFVGRQDGGTGVRGRERRWWCSIQPDVW